MRPLLLLGVVLGAACGPPIVVLDGGAGGTGGAAGGGGASAGGVGAAGGVTECRTYLGTGGGGATSGPGWLATLVPGPPGGGDLNSIFIREPGDIFVAGDSNRLYRRISPEWTEISTGLAADARILQVAAVRDSVVILAEQGGVRVARWAPLDGGAWASFMPEETPVLLSRPQGGSFDAPTVVSTDGGTWTVSRLQSQGWEVVARLDAGQAPYAAATGGREHWLAVDGGLLRVGDAEPRPLSAECAPAAAFFVYSDPADERQLLLPVGDNYFCRCAVSTARVI